jgi:hypothetical protein
MVTVLTTTVTGITADSALTGGEIKFDRWDSILERGVCWGLVDTPLATSPDRTDQGKGRGTFVSRIKPLKPNTIYYVRAYAKSIQGYIYGNVRSFKTPSRPPTVLTEPASGVTHQSASLAGNVTSDGGSTVTQRGFYWSLSNPNPTQNDNVLNAGNGTGSFAAPLTDLQGGRTYYFRGWASNSFGTTLAPNVISFTTAPAKIPIIGTTSVSSVTRNTAYAASNVTSNEGAQVTEYGFCWSTSPNPTYLLPTRRRFTGSILGAFNNTISGLSAGTTYYLRAYAVNAAGPGYSPQQVFTTTPVVLPTVTMTAASGTGTTTGMIYANVTDDGGSTVVARGFIVGTTNPPSGPLNQVGSGLGAFSLPLSSLAAGRTYYVRAYAINSLGTTALSSNILTFTTYSASPPVVTTNAPSSITATGFTCGGNVISDGGAPITERGLVYGTSPNPDINTGIRVTSGTGLGGFSSILSGLVSNRTYYVRAYASNGSATGYGVQQTVLTSLATPLLQSPASGSQVGCCYPSFLWGAVTGAAQYEIQFARNISFTGTLRSIGLCGGSTSLSASFVNLGTTTSPSFCINSGTSANNGTWYWRVRASNSTNISQWSATRTFNYTW